MINTFSCSLSKAKPPLKAVKSELLSYSCFLLRHLKSVHSPIARTARYFLCLVKTFINISSPANDKFRGMKPTSHNILYFCGNIIFPFSLLCVKIAYLG